MFGSSAPEIQSPDLRPSRSGDACAIRRETPCSVDDRADRQTRRAARACRARRARSRNLSPHRRLLSGERRTGRLAPALAHAADVALAGLGSQRDAGPGGTRPHLRSPYQRRPAADAARPQILRRCAARIRRPRPRGARADRQSGSCRRRGGRLRERLDADDEPLVGLDARRRRRADDERHAFV